MFPPVMNACPTNLGGHLHDVCPVGGASSCSLWDVPLSHGDRFLAAADWISEEQKKDSFTYIILQTDGLPGFNVRDSSRWRPNDGNSDNNGHWEDNGRGASMVGEPHYYLAINSLGFLPQHTPESVWAFVGKNFNQLFPWGGNSGGDQQSVKVGDVYRLTHLQIPDRYILTAGPYTPLGTVMSTANLFNTGFINQVEVVFTCGFLFVLKTCLLHAFDGIAIHGVLRDKSGEFWMFQEGYGSPRKPQSPRLDTGLLTYDPLAIAIQNGRDLYGYLIHLKDTDLNYWAAKRMWAEFARKTRAGLATGNPAAGDSGEDGL